VHWVWRKPAHIKGTVEFSWFGHMSRLLFIWIAATAMIGAFAILPKHRDSVLSDFLLFGIMTVPTLVGFVIHATRKSSGKYCVPARWFHRVIFSLPAALSMATLSALWYWDNVLWLTTLIIGGLTVALIGGILYFIIAGNDWNLAGDDTFATLFAVLLVPLLLNAFGARFIDRLETVLLPEMAAPPDESFSAVLSCNSARAYLPGDQTQTQPESRKFRPHSK
jgi:hypothetical protein